MRPIYNDPEVGREHPLAERPGVPALRKQPRSTLSHSQDHDSSLPVMPEVVFRAYWYSHAVIETEPASLGDSRLYPQYGTQEPCQHEVAEIRWHRLNAGDIANKASIQDRLQRAKRVREVMRSVRPHVGIGFGRGQFLKLWLYWPGLSVPMISAARDALARFDHMVGGSCLPLPERPRSA